jgi:hypothetical protein
MVYQGTVQNGVVVFPNGVQLPEGSPVRVELISNAPTETNGQRERTLFDVLNERGILGCFDGPTDLSTNPKHMEGFGESRQTKNSH